MNKDSKIYIAGHGGMVGGAIVRKLMEQGYDIRYGKSHKELDLRNKLEVEDYFYFHKPEYVFLAAAKVGGIVANDTYRAEFIYDNLMIQSNVIHAAYKYGVKKLLFLGSSCIYPKHSIKPLKEEDLMSGYLEPTNEPYAVAKIAGIKMCEAYRDQYGCNFISVMPPNLYGQGDKYTASNSHVVPSLIQRFHKAKIYNLADVIVWGSGEPFREFMYCDDLADCCIFLMNNYNERIFINSGTGEEVTIKQLANMIKEVVGFKGEIKFNTNVPDGTYRKVMDITRIHDMGWEHKISLQEGIKLAYKFYLKEKTNDDENT